MRDGNVKKDLSWVWMLALTVLCLAALTAAFWVEKVPRVLPVLSDAPYFSFPGSGGRKVGLNDLKGKVWVADFVYIHCTTQCPLMTSAMEKFQEKWKGKGLDLVSFALDIPNSPKEAVQYAQKAGADPNSWYFLSGATPDLVSLAEKGFHLSGTGGPGSDADFMHNSRLVLVDGGGHIRGYYDGMKGKDLQDLDDALGTLLLGAHEEKKD